MDQNVSYDGEGAACERNRNYNDGGHNDTVDAIPDGNACSRGAQVVSIPTSPAQVIPYTGVSYDSEKYYFMGNEERSVAIILNHHFHNSTEERKGSEVDKARVVDTFRHLDFEVRTFDNESCSTIKEILRSVAAEEERNRRRDCIAVVVLTHGCGNGRLAASDDSYEVRDLWQPFLARNCPSLAGKPKLFFIQACRGCDVDAGVRVRAPGRDVPDSVPWEEVSYTVPSYADILISYATFEGQYAFRNTTNGSWYIQTLCSQLLQQARNTELTMLLTDVQKDVGQKFLSHNDENPKLHGKVQAPCYTSSLTKRIIFH